MEDRIKTKVSERVAWVGYIISFLFAAIGIIGAIFGLFFDTSVVDVCLLSVIYGLIIYICWEAFSKIVKAAEIYIEKNKELIE